jgi:hypothetical protein
MSNDLLFCVVKEFGKRKTGKADIAGKIFQIKLLLGNLSVGDAVSLYCVDLDNPKRKCDFNRVDCTVKEIKRLDADTNEFDETASCGDIVTVNFSKQCSVDGKKIDRNDILTKNNTIGVSQDETCVGENLLRLRFMKSAKFIEKLGKSISKKQSIESGCTKKQHRTCVVSFLWFGKKIAAEVVAVDAIDGIVSFRLLNNQSIPIPKSSELRVHVERVVVKDHYGTEQRGRNKSGEAKWRYYSGKIVFDD